MKNGLLFLVEGFEEVEAVSTCDILRRGGVSLTTVSLSETLYVTGAHGITVLADAFFRDILDKNVDLIVLPGGSGHVNFYKYPEFLEFVRTHANALKTTAAICAAPSVLGKIGILAGKTAVCYPGCESALIGAEISNDDVVVSENIITGKGPGVTNLFAFKILDVLFGENMTQQTKEAFLFKNI